MRLLTSKYYQSWKDSTNNKVTIVAKNIKNDIPINNVSYPVWNDDCAIKKYKFNANPIKHYRKQYTNINLSPSTFSKLSLIGLMDKPGGTINSLINENDCTSLANNSNLNIITNFDTLTDCTSDLCSSALVIKRATTVLSNNYSSSSREYLYNKCKTFSQNLPSQQKNGTRTFYCNDVSNANCVTFNPSNKTFQTQGPVSSSARTYSLKYGCMDGASCNKKVSINNCPPTMSLQECATLKKLLNNPSAICVGCINDPSTIRRKRINILK